MSSSIAARTYRHIVIASFGGAGTPDDPAWVDFTLPPGVTAAQLDRRIIGYTISPSSTGLSARLDGYPDTPRTVLAACFFNEVAGLTWEVHSEDA